MKIIEKVYLSERFWRFVAKQMLAEDDLVGRIDDARLHAAHAPARNRVAVLQLCKVEAWSKLMSSKYSQA